jgi:outer membrane protein assembly factor BamE (lipoprotein component of BamABCDE complex)
VFSIGCNGAANGRKQLIRTILIVLASCSLIAGCTTASQHAAQVNAGDEARLTLAAVQRTVPVGMSGARVLETLGSPNIISTDDERNEVWVPCSAMCSKK